MTEYRRCILCWRIVECPDGEYWKNEGTCPECGKTHSHWHGWPSPSVKSMLLLIEDCRYRPNGRMISVIFTVTALESLLYELLEYGLFPGHPNRDRPVKCLEEYDNFPRREHLYFRMRGIKLKRRLKYLQYGDFYDRWQTVMTARNKIVHGDFFYSLTKVIPEELLINSCKRVFADLNNDYWDYVDENELRHPHFQRVNQK